MPRIAVGAEADTAILDTLNQAVSRLHAYETDEPHTRGATEAVA